MYFAIHIEDQMPPPETFRPIRVLMIRCVMNGCGHCMNSQPEWDKMVKEVKPKLADDTAIVEVERQLVDPFRKLIEDKVDFPEIDGFPTTVISTPQGVHMHEGRDRDSYIKALQLIKAIPSKSSPTRSIPTRSRPSKTKKSKSRTVQDPRLKLIRGGKLRKLSRKRRKRK